ncbi:hypothetical protein M9458_050432 [Cirrhinus mrigala]|uniref:Uncharacterized protein n=1 Tax=Cirrhinus mrigala TaxID=683832 RepID=A0ABD0MWE4_CIRMR
MREEKPIDVPAENQIMFGEFEKTPTSPAAPDLQQRVMERDLQLGQSLRGILALLDLQVLARHRVPSAAVGRQLMHQLVLSRQGQAQARLTAVRETQLPPPAGPALRPAGPAHLRALGEEPLSQQAVEELVAGRTVLAQDEDVGGATDHILQIVLLVTRQRDTAELT